MAKTLVVGTGGQDTRIPFLRGILTRSLQDAGLPFEEAYALASAIREELSDRAEITSEELYRIVLQRLSEGSGDAILQRYQAPATSAPLILVRHAGGQVTPFSREQHRRHLVSSGLSSEDSTAMTTSIHNHLTKKGRPEISSRYLGLLTYKYIYRYLGQDTARRYLVLVDFLRGRRPLVLLICGAPGCGKSSIATDVAHRLDIARTQSTDLLREVMRMMIPERLMPVLHTSSFNAWRALAARPKAKRAPNALLIDGYRAQAELLSVSCEAVIRRSIREHSSLILEGVHVQHSLLAKVAEDSDAVVVPVMLAILNPDRLRARITRRGHQALHRRAERYLQNFDAIWRLQSFLLAEADQARVPIIRNNDKDDAIAAVVKTIIDYLSADFSADPREVFR